MLGRIIIDIASVVLAASGLGVLSGGVVVTFRYSRPIELNGVAGRQVREAGYYGAAIGLCALILDLAAGLY